MSTPPVPRTVLDRFEVTVMRYLGGRANRHWLVSAGRDRAVLRQYQPHPQGDVAYESAVLKALDERGWPTPVALTDPLEVDRRLWCLYRWVPGHSKNDDDLHRRGRLLARLHRDTQVLAALGQRSGCARAEDVVTDRRLTDLLRTYETLRPEPARIMRWHQDRANEIFAQLDLRRRQLLVLHGDFADRNLLYQNDELTGIIDFEGTHLNHRASEFALAWRGKRDALIHAYDAESPLDEIDWALLAPTLWSWAFLGVAEEIERMLNHHAPVHDFDWQIRTLLRRSPLIGRAQAPYPG